jgi:hypothetical protein
MYLNREQVLLSTIVCLVFLDNVTAANDETTDKTTTQEPGDILILKINLCYFTIHFLYVRVAFYHI